MSVLVTGVEPGSPAEKENIRAGDTIFSINGHEILDVLDYRFYMVETGLKIILGDSKGKKRKIFLEKEEYEDPGLDFESYLMDQKRSCSNGCIFCFIDQLPRGMRESLYFKDDDARLSFLMGNYITLTNLTQREIDRIIHMHISPVNVSVHTTNPELRVRMMKNRNAGKCLEIIQKFASAGIKMNCQLVLCKGINDGVELDRSLRDLCSLYPAVESVAVVPVGLTRYREGLTALEPYSREGAREVVEQAERFGSRFLKEHGARIVYAADEFYIKAGQEIPPAAFYGEFNQLENGIGLIALLQSQFDDALDKMALKKPRSISIATGKAAHSFLEKLSSRAQEAVAGLNCTVYAIENEFFGKNVDVAGLVTGKDLIRQLKGKRLGEELLIPAVMLRSERDVFLDDLTVADVEKALAVRVLPVENDGYELFDAMTGRK
ncbi:MAG TPA: DUF512 domain-containing protein [Clostridia bacterium]|nr:DUF512 domain-containing protein [Clostridia bacterium]